MFKLENLFEGETPTKTIIDLTEVYDSHCKIHITYPKVNPQRERLRERLSYRLSNFHQEVQESCGRPVTKEATRLICDLFDFTKNIRKKNEPYLLSGFTGLKARTTILASAGTYKNALGNCLSKHKEGESHGK